MKKILIGFIAIGLLTFVGCEKEDDSSIEYGEGATDIDGNTYQSVIIGTQEWMSENLRTTKYSDGTAIPNVIGNTDWENLSTGAWCHYDNDIDYESTYGKLYNWYAVETGKLCPAGWHVPTHAEWTEFASRSYLRGISIGGTDDYGWNCLPGGGRRFFFGDIGYLGHWWSSSQQNADDAWYFELRNTGFMSRDYSKNFGFSVRCLRD